jgi:thioredoxin-related protein
MKKRNKVLYTLTIFIWLIASIDVKTSAQNGIHFEQKLAWSQIKVKASFEHKDIFVDCFATWCGPCRKMDREVYPEQTVGEYFNTHFISVKVQMDSTKNDNEFIKGWYVDAHQLMKNEHVTAFPTYLFFSPDGGLLHSDLGFKSVTEFLALAKEAENPKRQYLVVLARYRSGKKDYQSYPFLFLMSKMLKNEKLTDSIANDYVDNFLPKAPKKQLYTEDNLKFLGRLLLEPGSGGISSPVFKFFVDHSKEIDAATYKGNTVQIIDGLNFREIVNPFLGRYADSGGDPDWLSLNKSVSKRSGKVNADRIALLAKAQWYYAKKDWKKAIRYNAEKLEKYTFNIDHIDTIAVNNPIYSIFVLHCDDEKTLKKALKWQRMVTDTVHLEKPFHWEWADTYANLLYKIGHTKEAIELEDQCAAALQKIRDDNPNGRMQQSYVDHFQQIADKMRAGRQEWEQFMGVERQID